MPRLRDLGITLGDLAPGTYNAITDVPGIKVGHATVIHDQPRVARTGVTVILPPPDDIYHNPCYGAFHSFNGNGEMTGYQGRIVHALPLDEVQTIWRKHRASV